MSDAFYSFLLFAVVATITPGGATTLATASGSRFGYAKSLPLILGMAIGLTALVGSTATGLAALIHTVPALSLGMKLVGTVYLLWLALKIARAGAPNTGGAVRTAPIGFPGGLVLLVLNPKAWTMALGAAASFAGLAADPLHLAVLLGGTFGLAGLTSLSLWCLGGAVLARLLRNERQWTILNGALGALLALSIASIWFG
jgi:threonine/homoserine/homoserine lactone efflux protein